MKITNVKSYEAADTVDLQNSDKYIGWVHSLPVLAMIELLGDNVKAFTSIFGKQTFCYRCEYYTRNWVLEYKGYTFVLVTAKGRGSSYEMNMSWEDMQDNKDIDVILEFMKDLLSKIQEYGSSH